MSPILTLLLKDTFTLRGLKYRVNILRFYLIRYFFGTQSQEERQWDDKDLVWLIPLASQISQKFTKDNIYDAFADLEKQVSQLKVIIVYLTFEPDEFSLREIGTKVRTLFSDIPLLDIKFDPNLIAGAALVWKGVYKDFSLRAAIEQKKQIILGNFKKYFK